MKFSRNEITDVLKKHILKTQYIDVPDRQYDVAVFNSRECVENIIFIAIDGAKSAGVKYVEDAIKNSAACVVANIVYFEELENICEKYCETTDFIFVDDSLLFFGLLGKMAREKYSGDVVGVIGSVGKTTTKNMLRELGGGHDYIHANRASFNSQSGVPLTLCAIPGTSHRVIQELGEAHFGDLTYITEFAQPTVLVVTNVEDAHTEFLGDTHGVAKTLNEAIVFMRQDGTVIAPISLRHREEVLANCQASIIYIVDETTGESPGDDSASEYAFIKEIIQNDDLTHNVVMEFRDEVLVLRVPLVGHHFVIDAVLAVTASMVCGDDPKVLPERLLKVEPQGHRMRIVDTGEMLIVDDCYNANPASMKASMDAVVALGKQHARRTVFFMGPMRELGERSDELHLELGRYAESIGIDVLVCVDKATRAASEQSVHHHSYYFDSVARCCESLFDIVEVKDIVGVKASRGPDASEPALFPIVRKLEDYSELT